MSSGLGISNIPTDLLYVGLIRALILQGGSVVMYASDVSSKSALVKIYRKAIYELKQNKRALYDKHNLAATYLPWISNRRFNTLAKEFRRAQ